QVARGEPAAVTTGDEPVNRRTEHLDDRRILPAQALGGVDFTKRPRGPSEVEIEEQRRRQPAAAERPHDDGLRRAFDHLGTAATARQVLDGEVTDGVFPPALAGGA